MTVQPSTVTGPRVQGPDAELFMDFLDRSRPEIDARIDEHIAQVSGGDRGLEDHFHGGKRLRAGTVLLVYESLSDDRKGRDMAMDLAAAVEIAHGTSLMIDDMLDGDRVRRGTATFHALRGPTRTMLEAVRLLAVPYSLAAPHGSTAVGNLARTHEEMVRGSLIELDPAGPGAGVAAYDRLISLKSGGLFELAARFGALAAGCCEEKAGLVGAYGSGLGTVHQFSDDIADLRGALQAGREVTGSESLLFRCTVRDAQERKSAADRCVLPEDVESRLIKELQLRVRRAERAAIKMVGTVGRCGGRRSISPFLPILRSAPYEIARLMIPLADPGSS